MDVIKPHTKTYFKGGLRNIRQKELDAIAKIGADKTRLALHLTPPVGWLNDPNGLCFSNGYYHVFFQYSPEDVNGGRKYWGHYRSADLIDWEYLGVAIRPDTEFDRDGVYSGSAVAEDGAISIFYTGNVKFEGDYDYINNGRGSYTIYAVCEDGVNVKGKTVALRNSDYPPDLTCHVRDPKVWKADGKYYMVLGARTKSDVGEVLVYESEDKLSWRLINRLGSENRLGYMWECPDLFEVGGLTLLSVSPQGVEADGYDFNNIYQSGYMPINTVANISFSELTSAPMLTSATTCSISRLLSVSRSSHPENMPSPNTAASRQLMIVISFFFIESTPIYRLIAIYIIIAYFAYNCNRFL